MIIVPRRRIPRRIFSPMTKYRGDLENFVGKLQNLCPSAATAAGKTLIFSTLVVHHGYRRCFISSSFVLLVRENDKKNSKAFYRRREEAVNLQKGGRVTPVPHTFQICLFTSKPPVAYIVNIRFLSELRRTHITARLSISGPTDRGSEVST